MDVCGCTARTAHVPATGRRRPHRSRIAVRSGNDHTSEPAPGAPAPRPAPSAPVASTGASPSLLQRAINLATVPACPLPPEHEEPRTAAPELLPTKDLGTLMGGNYPFVYDPVYGLPVVREVVPYAKVLRDIRTGKVRELLWFFDPNYSDPLFIEGRCLIRYKDDSVAQSVIPAEDERAAFAMEAHGVLTTKIPLEPRLVAEYSWRYDGQAHPLIKWYNRTVHYREEEDTPGRRGPRIGPTLVEEMIADKNRALVDEIVEEAKEHARDAGDAAMLMGTETEWDCYGNVSSRAISDEAKANVAARERASMALVGEEVTEPRSFGFVSQDFQVAILKVVPILGPAVGFAMIIGMYLLTRLFRGDLTDRMTAITQEDKKRARDALKEVRMAFLEEEIPGLVAKGADLEKVRKRCADVNKKLGDKLEISESELVSTFDACQAILKEGVDLSVMASDAGTRKLAEQEAAKRRSSPDEADDGNQMDAAAQMGKLATARIKKAVDPRTLDVKKRVRDAKRKMKRDSKVQINDEIIFFDDVAGNEQAKVELMEVVDFFRAPQKFRASGAKAPKGVLLVGPPGNGKTLMARAVAGESGVAFISSSAAEFIELYMGLGAARVRDLFNTARKLAPCIIFIDELDAVGRARSTGGGGNDERDNTVNQLLTEMDGFEAETAGIVIIGATNRKDVLDVALTRAGRFDRSIEVKRPNFKGRVEALQVHLRNKPIDGDIDYAVLASAVSGMSGAQIAGVCNNACFMASREGRQTVTQADLISAAETETFGRVHDKSLMAGPDRRRRFAVMEAGISIAATLLPAMERVDYVTILPSLQSPVGRTVLESNIGRYTTGVWTRRYLREQLQVALAGRAAEEIMYGLDGLSSLNQSRLQFAREIVHKMLNSGMSAHPDFRNIRTLGPTFNDPGREPGLWQTTTVTTDWNMSRSEWIDVDMEMEAMLNDSYEQVKAMLQRNGECLHAVADLLFQRGKVLGDELRDLIERTADQQDLQARAAEKETALL